MNNDFIEYREISEARHIEDSPLASSLFGDVRWAWIWLVLRLIVGWDWLVSGWQKLSDPNWAGHHSGVALSAYINKLIASNTGLQTNLQGWYTWSLQRIVLPHAIIWSVLISWGEFFIGIALILGLFTGLAAFLGCLLNFNYMLGAVSVSPLLMLLATVLVLTWKTAGWIGLDRWVLPILGQPWRPEYQYPPVEDKQQGDGQSLAHHTGQA